MAPKRSKRKRSRNFINHDKDTEQWCQLKRESVYRSHFFQTSNAERLE